MVLYFDKEGIIHQYDEVMTEEELQAIIKGNENNMAWYDDVDRIFEAEGKGGKQRRFVYKNGEVHTLYEDIEVQFPEPEPTEEEMFQAELLLNQVVMLENQVAQDVVLAEILLGQQGV